MPLSPSKCQLSFQRFVSLLHRAAIGLKHFSTVDLVFHTLSIRESECGRSVARVSDTLVIGVRERFVGADCRLYKFREEVLGVQCRLGEGRAVLVVLRVVDWK